IALKGYLTLIVILAALTILLAGFNFQHNLPKKFAFLISSSIPINGLAYFTTVLVIGQITLDRITFWAALVIFIFLIIIFALYRWSITPAKSALPTLKRHEEKREELKRKIKWQIKHAIQKKIEAIEEPMLAITGNKKKTNKKTEKKEIKKADNKKREEKKVQEPQNKKENQKENQDNNIR
ncbi:MAG: hypothetical protein KJ574_00655, partial [Nanoarchaeota archaeon]|nr:hypothetical protein [Nanoarchaeota archaeon]